MMTRIYKKFVFLYIFIFLFSFHCFSETKWVIAGQKFTNTRGKTTSVTEGIAKMFPSRILEKLSTNLYRNLSNEELIYKDITSLKNERTSLFLQLSSEVKKRDSFVTGNYNQRELEIKISEQEDKIKKIQEKINENLEKQKKIEDLVSVDKKQIDKKENQKNILDYMTDLFGEKNVKDEEILDKVVLYKNDFETLFVPSETARKNGITSVDFRNDISKEGINGLITGKISLYGDYYSLTVDLYVFPMGNIIKTVTEVGSLSEVDLISSLVARELTPAITNSLPVNLIINVFPEEIVSDLMFYVDDNLINNSILNNPNLGVTIDSGIHLLQFSCDGYDPITTSYAFEGNKKYQINVNLMPKIEKEIKIQFPPQITGSAYLHGISYPVNENGESNITINNKQVLGIFVTDENQRAFFILPENQIEKLEAYKLDVKPYDRSEYIEKHRRRMYNSYGFLMTSLIPTFFTMGQAISYQSANAYGYLQPDQIFALNAWTISQYACAGISVGCGIWFIYELIQYFRAADSVLPAEAKEIEKKVEENKSLLPSNQENSDTIIKESGDK